ncbi:MAG: hypothetical protein AVO38_06250 [delta proteobacterium ML8_D]|jgi:hypothetical protein|nr:MAG: hypothetical protein AVO38_06250 [delta proteobacterium ML8_D]
MPEKNTGYYVLVVWGDVSPDLQGPFTDEPQRDTRARQLKAEYGDEHGIYALDVDSEGRPTVRSYLAMFFWDITEGDPKA